jgi:uncharacterized protein
MAQNTDVLELGRFGLSSGEARSLELTVAIGDIQLAGQRYAAVESRVPVRLDITRMLGGWTLRLRYAVRMEGPCMRCLEDAHREMRVDSREIHQPDGGDDELNSPYIVGDDLDLHAWARDALVLELPTQIVCREDCRGICAICGENLNHAGPEHAHEKAPDVRWSKLSDIRFD